MEEKASGVKYILRYMVIAFLLPFICVVLQKFIKSDIVDFLLYGIQAASPSIAAIVEIKYFEKRRFDDYFNINISKMAIIVPLLLACVTMMFSKIIYAFIVGDSIIISGLSVKRWIVVSWALIAEEVGWRGFLETSLRTIIKKSALATFITGIIWSCWHYHYFIQNGIEIPILLFVVGAVAESFIYSYLLIFTNRNLLSAMTYHFSWNLFLHLFLINPSDNNGSLIPYIVVVLFEIVIVLFMFFITRSKWNIVNKGKAR